jgi:hypothetical protein
MAVLVHSNFPCAVQQDRAPADPVQLPSDIDSPRIFCDANSNENIPPQCATPALYSGRMPLADLEVDEPHTCRGVVEAILRIEGYFLELQHRSIQQVNFRIVEAKHKLQYLRKQRNISKYKVRKYRSRIARTKYKLGQLQSELATPTANTQDGQTIFPGRILDGAGIGLGILMPTPKVQKSEGVGEFRRANSI